MNKAVINIFFNRLGVTEVVGCRAQLHTQRASLAWWPFPRPTGFLPTQECEHGISRPGLDPAASPWGVA